MYAVGNAFGQGIPVFGLLQAFGLRAVGAVAYFHQHAGHGRSDKHVERRALGAVVVDLMTALFNLGDGIFLYFRCQLAGFLNSRAEQQVSQNGFHFPQAVIRAGVFQCGEAHAFLVAREIEIIGFKPRNIGLGAGVDMDGDEQIPFFLYGEV